MNHKKPVQYILAAVIFAILGIAGIIVFSISMSSMNARYSGISKEEEDIIIRTAAITGSSDSTDEVIRMVGSDVYSVGDYVIRSLTSAEYLSRDVDDDEFAKDLATILLGNNNDDFDSIVISDLSNHTRMYAANSQLKALDRNYAATSEIGSGIGDSFEDCTITRSVGGVDGYTIGIRKVEGYFRSTGTDLRTDFFVDGTLYQGSINIENSDDSDAKNFVMAWNTAGVDAGTHNVVILMRSSDGRGHLMDGGEINVPYCASLENRSVQAGTLGFDCSWYVFTPGSEDAYVNFVGLSEDIKVTIYDAYGNPIGANDVVSTDYEVARARSQDVDQISAETGIPGVTNTYYLKTERGMNANPDNSLVVYTVVTGKEVARYDGSFMAVLSDVGDLSMERPLIGYADHPDTVMLKSGDGTELEVEYNSVSFVPLNGFLNDFSIAINGTENQLSIFPDFSRKEISYGYYANGAPFTVNINAVAQEGYAATLEISLHNSMGDFDIVPGADVTIQEGENVITAVVHSFTGYVKTYSVYILNGDDSGDFYESTLINFPESYRAGLWMLHNIHPNYNFRAYNTGLDFYTVLDNEDSGSRSLANDYSHPGWVKPDSPVYDGGGWKAARNEVVQYFLDPRNFLEQVHIFQFEMLSFDPSAQTMDGINNILDGSFMDTNDPNYAQILYEAGQTANVSPYFLASRIIQEMGYSGVSPLCHGTLPGYEGYYNFFDIGATPDPEIENGAQINGARYAMWGAHPEEQEITAEEASLMLPWNTVERSITGGALWIASRYTSAGQDTLYYQKFDVIDNDDGLYEHQYAQNISMAYSEGARYYDGYASINMLDNSFTFIIPVYDNMPEEFGVMPQA